MYYKKLAHTIMEAGKFNDLQSESESWKSQESQWCSFSRRLAGLRTQEGSISQFEDHEQEEFSLTQGRVNLLVLFRPSAEWIRSIYIMEGNLIYSVYLFNVNLVKKKKKTPSQKHPE